MPTVYTLWDFTSNLVADYTATEFSVDPQEILPIIGEKDIEIHQFHDSRETIIHSDVSRFWFELQWKYLSEADHSTIFDFYHDPNKACAQAKTFYFVVPTQYCSHTFTVSFDCTWKSFLQNYQNYGIASLLLYVAGRKAEA